MNKNLVRSRIIERFGSVHTFSKELGTSESLLSLWLNRKRIMPLEMRLKWVALLGVRAKDLEPSLDTPIRKIVARKGGF